MNGNENSGPGIGLSFTRLMPLAWQRVGKDADASASEAEQNRNERLLQLLLLYDDYPADRRNQEGEHSGDLERIEAKLDAVIHLLASLISQRESGLEKRLVSVAAQYLEWIEGKLTAPAAGDPLCILLEIDPRIPQPLKMVAQTVQLKPVDDDNVRVRVKLQNPGERAQEALEKMIFRIHRREVARWRTDEGA